MKNSPAKYLWWLIGFSVVFGIADALLPRNGSQFGALTLPFWVVCAILLFKWCKAHAQASGVQEPPGSAALCGLFAPAGVPLYFFRAFGIKIGAFGTAKAIGFYILFALAYGTTNVATGYIAHNTSLNLTRGADAPLTG